ncbi:hypothetical protein Lpp221_12688 [Lacticaseibacillus paracasei subsp. paracasei Lpp221]|nr:hypothetical protein LPEG9_16400 [Lacticaseibacillus paracasei]EPC56985.1 hypothetical protein Lpp189_13017 [Lacticaseibacillus paracasei subsp. paracasei Lpp189]EPC60781.1 hypothetical protein Lpp228_14602 [Lacticaseibacillus paracasei subsp. paracasei Lpp228]EPC77839.1 hypothetical protein Lpp221_12688 [Lacticaseibacillus paracasei subsp. paracasei Lpp221]EPC95104.1 hypothetical protein Lpp27_12644 [Lacticaseibacillus paracasei subsp. paracasei CNCM I-4648]EPD10175.1 hypothetical protein 
MVDPGEPIFEKDWIATQFILIFCLEKNVHVLTRAVATVDQNSSGNVTLFKRRVGLLDDHSSSPFRRFLK